MPSKTLRQHIDHQAEVNRLMLAAGLDGEDAVLTNDELYLHGLAVTAGVTPREFVNQIRAQRAKAAA